MAECVLSELDDSNPTSLDVDPDTYEDSAPMRRLSSHPTLGGGRVWQDFAAHACDRQIRLHTGWMEEATRDAFLTKFNQQGKVWKWADHMGNAYKVVFRVFTWEKIRGYAAYDAEMTFEVVDVLT